MGLSETMLFYLLIGLAVGVATWVAGANERDSRLFRAASAVPFWPLYLPILLSAERPAESPPAPSPPPLADELSQKIAEVERELDGAFSSLDGWAEEALSRERGYIVELRSAWNSQAARIRAMDQLLADVHVFTKVEEPRGRAVDPIHQCERARLDNFTRLKQVRERAYDDLTTSLARVRELVSLIHLAKFTGAPASRAEQLVSEIAASVAGLSEVATWHEPMQSDAVASDLAPVTNVPGSVQA